MVNEIYNGKIVYGQSFLLIYQFRMKHILYLFILLFFCSCHDPLDRSYNPVSFEKDLQEIRESNTISEQEFQDLAKFIVLARLTGNDMKGESYKTILDRINSLQQQSGIKEKEMETKRARLSAWLEVALLEKVFIMKKEKPFIIYTVQFKNISSSAIKTIIGHLSINDLLDKPIKQIDILVEEPVKPGLTLVKTYTIPYDHASENDQRVRSKDLVDMRVVWNPDKIIIEDGKILQ